MKLEDLQPDAAAHRGRLPEQIEKECSGA